MRHVYGIAPKPVCLEIESQECTATVQVLIWHWPQKYSWNEKSCSSAWLLNTLKRLSPAHYQPHRVLHNDLFYALMNNITKKNANHKCRGFRYHLYFYAATIVCLRLHCLKTKKTLLGYRQSQYPIIVIKWLNWCRTHIQDNISRDVFKMNENSLLHKRWKISQTLSDFIDTQRDWHRRVSF